MITITRKSPLTGNYNSIRFTMPNEEFFNWCDMPKEFRPELRSAFPSLTEQDRDFILYGVLPGEWAKIVSEAKANNLRRCI